MHYAVRTPLSQRQPGIVLAPEVHSDGAAGAATDMGGIMEHERLGEAFEGEVRLTVVGDQLRAGDPAPDFILDALGPGEATPREITLGSGAGRVRLLHVVNSLDTPVCHIGAHRFDELKAAALPPDVDVYTVSMDLPFAQARWRGAENVRHEALSSHRSETFGESYGVLLREWRLLQRAVFVIDGDGRVAHAEYVADQMAEPDYAAAVAAARSLSKSSQLPSIS
jgi:thiol peroxidase